MNIWGIFDFADEFIGIVSVCIQILMKQCSDMYTSYVWVVLIFESWAKNGWFLKFFGQFFIDPKATHVTSGTKLSVIQRLYDTVFVYKCEIL